MEPAIGAQLGNYRLVRVIGTGGFAHVYLGQHIYLDTEAAIKVLDVGFDLANADMERFLREARLIARLRHPSIVSVLEFGVEKDVPYLVMEYAARGSLRTRHPKGTVLPLSTVASYVQQVASALQYAHEHSVVHCDVKPENMLIGEDEKILLSDFGIARVVRNTIQTTHDVVGTVYYMAPEQFAGKPIPASDQYALAVVVYQWLSGQLPFEGNNIAEIFFMHTRMKPLPLLSLVPAIPPTVEAVIFRALEKDPQQRFPDMASFAAAFAEAVQTIQLPTVGGVSANPAVPQTFAAPGSRTWYTPADDKSDTVWNWPPTVAGSPPAPAAQALPEENIVPSPTLNTFNSLPSPPPLWPLPPSIVPLEAAEDDIALPQVKHQRQEPSGLLDAVGSATVLQAPGNGDSPENLLPPLSLYLPLAQDQDVVENAGPDIEEDIPTLIVAPQPPQPEPFPQAPSSLPGDSGATLLLPTFMDFLPPTKDVLKEPPVLAPQAVPEPLPEPESTPPLPPLSIMGDSGATLLLPTFMDFLPPVPVSIEDILTIVDLSQSREPSPEPDPAPPPKPEPALSPKPKTGIEIFISYSHRDKKYRDELDTFLEPLKINYPAAIWYDGEIRPGVDFEQEIEKHLYQAQIILLLVSPHFVASQYCREKELKPAMERHIAGETRVIPVIVRPSMWQEDKIPFGKLQALPKYGKPITRWQPRDTGYLDVAEGIKRVIIEMLRKP